MSHRWEVTVEGKTMGEIQDAADTAMRGFFGEGVDISTSRRSFDIRPAGQYTIRSGDGTVTTYLPYFRALVEVHW